jgi:hypothetical protein
MLSWRPKDKHCNFRSKVFVSVKIFSLCSSKIWIKVQDPDSECTSSGIQIHLKSGSGSRFKEHISETLFCTITCLVLIGYFSVLIAVFSWIRIWSDSELLNWTVPIPGQKFFLKGTGSGLFDHIICQFFYLA